MVKCADCGYLAVRNAESFRLEEAIAEYRESGFSYLGEPYIGILLEGSPLCFARSFDLTKEIAYEFAKGGKSAADFTGIRKSVQHCIKEGLVKERDCAQYTKWQQGFTPKEHREMMDRERRQEWETKQEHYLVKMAGIFAIVAGIVGAAIGAFITWLLTTGGHP